MIIGIMGTKDGGKHISVFFIAPEFHRQGIGKRLFEFAYRDREPDGLKYTPMRRSAEKSVV